MKKEIYISVDIETDGPIPGDYSMMSFGACVVGSPEISFYRELKPISDKFIPETVAVPGLNRDQLIKTGVDPAIAMQEFVLWLSDTCGQTACPIFIAFNATFDWMFINWYLIHFVGNNPFGISGWDIKAYYAGITRSNSWSDTSKKKMNKRFLSPRPHTHNALDDAREQAEIFMRLREEAKSC